MNDQQMLRYSRHLLLPQAGHEAQERWLAAHVIIIGIGGLGSPAAQYLASAGVGKLTLCDHDVVELTNLQRQTLYAVADIGKRKVEAARERLLAINSEIDIQTRDEKLTLSTLMALAQGASVILDCSDNFETRHAVNRACVAARVPLISGAAIRFDGQITVFDNRDAASPCYHCLFAENEAIENVRCATMGVFAPLVGMIGAMQAGEALKLIAGIGETLANRLLVLNALSMQWQTIRIKKNPDCLVCAAQKTGRVE
ncbi:MAG: HesA/MoeB/ThiF family protein [Burkholderiales bacterium]|jgi:molybdopterin/thiamine biosynthesis adenylyltransferase|nr:HesA/MoeB/ThiF family protein [Burkholderiales bacterium]